MKGLFDNILSPHPYRIIGAYYVNETMNITGDVIFNLFFSSTIITQFGNRYKDNVNVSLHKYDSFTGAVTPIENASMTITLDPEAFGEVVQKQDDIKIKNVLDTLYEGEYLLISVEIIQSKKLIYNFAERAYERTLKPLLERFANLLNNSEDPQISELGGIAKDLLTGLEMAGIGVEDIAYLFNTFTSSSFYFGSDSFKSSVFIPLSNSKNNVTLYFHNIPSIIDFETGLGLGNIIDADMTKPTSGSDYMWPPLPFTMDLESETGGTEWFNWFIIWLIYHLDDIVFINEDIRTYYLTKDNTLVLKEPEGNTPLRQRLTNTPTKWEGIILERNKIITNATAKLYLHYPRLIALRKVIINATLYDEREGTAIGSDQQMIDRTTLIELLRRGPDSPTLFLFKNAIGKEIWNNHNLSLHVSVSQTPLFSLRAPRLVCDSTTYPSSITLRLKETENIQIEDLEDKKIIPGATEEIIINIESKYEDSIDIEVGVNHTNNINHWDIIYTDSIEVSKNDSVSISVFVTHTENTSEAYDDYIDLIVNVTGKTGFDREESEVKVHTDAVDIDFEVVKPKNKEIKHGKKGAYKIVVKNMNNGFLTDTYKVNVTSEHDWGLVYPDTIRNIEPYVQNGEKYILSVTLKVPEDTEIPSDKLTITLSSEEARLKNESKVVTITVTTKVITPNILEQIYNFFEALAEDLGLEKSAAAYIVVAIILLVLLFLIIVIYLRRRKFIEIICLDRIKKITPDEKATFDIKIKNPFKQTQTYEVNAEMVSESNRWEISLDKTRLIINSKQSDNIKLLVLPTDYVKSDDWIEVGVIVKAVEKEKISEISTITTIKEGKPEIDITGVFHWPRVFKKGDRVETTFRLSNRGNTSASNNSVILYVNGKEKNKVNDITIPRGGYADLEIPWIAVKGKNKIDIEVK
jgi:hypothetical protein